jgi:hypothetical protein
VATHRHPGPAKNPFEKLGKHPHHGNPRLSSSNLIRRCGIIVEFIEEGKAEIFRIEIRKFERAGNIGQ